MLSPGLRTPLNFNTATETSSLITHLFLLPSSSSSSSALPAKSKHRPKISSASSLSSVVLTSLRPSFSPPFIVLVISYLLCQALVHAVPVDRSDNATTTRGSFSNGSDQLSKENLNSSHRALQEEMPQNDSPRSISDSQTVPVSWKKQSQDRFYYLRAENDQFLQFHGYQVTGTKVAKPVLGVVRFMSHEASMVIVGFHEKRYLCMNSTFALYLSDRIDPECYIEESSLLESGSHATAYDFIKYKTHRKLYLGINCDPMLGSETNLSMKSTRFSRLDITEEEADVAEKEVAKSGPERHVQEKCQNISERRSAARIKRRRLRNRWCWNIDRMLAHRLSYLQQCKEREGDKCDKNNLNKDSEDCVCDILIRMLMKPKRAKRKCLVDKITKWVKHQNSTPNSLAIIEVSRLLLPSYSGIARRMHLLNSKDKFNKKTNPQSMPSHPKNSDKGTSTLTSHRIRHQCHDESSKKCHHKSIKLNSVLEKHRQELVISDQSPSLGEDPSLATQQSLGTTNFSSVTETHKEVSVLSDKFRKALKLLTKTNSQRDTSNQRGRKTRHLPNSHLKSTFNSTGDDYGQSSPDFDTPAAG